MSTRWPRPLVAAIDAVNRRGKAVGVRLVRYTGKSRHLIHPKHLVDTPWHDWYVERLDPRDAVIDVGCANGAHTLRAARRARSVFGMDYDIAQRRVPAAEARALGRKNAHVFAWRPARPFPFPEGSLDAALF